MATSIPTNHAAFSVGEICEATKGVFRGSGTAQVRGVFTDTRALSKGALFVALKGENFDAHDFLPQAIENGAAVLMVDKGRYVPPGIDTIEVQSTLKALGDLAAKHRADWGGDVVGITGSVGKTTTKELVFAALQTGGGKVHKTQGNLNNQIGVPMTLFGLSDAHDVAVIEMGTSEKGEIRRLAEIAAPNVGVVTAIAASHTEGLGSVEDVAIEKLSLFGSIKDNGAVVGCGDDRAIAEGVRSSDSRSKWLYGCEATNDVQLVEWDDSQNGSQCRYLARGLERDVNVSLRLLGKGAALAAGAALSVAQALDHNVESVSQGLTSVRPAWGRMRPLVGQNGIVVIDDAYNANPVSMALSIQVAAGLAQNLGRRFVAVLADMKELGALETEAHCSTVTDLLAMRPGVFVACGSAMTKAARSIATNDVQVECVPNSKDAASAVIDLVEANDLVLVKGSRLMAMEKVNDALHAVEIDS